MAENFEIEQTETEALLTPKKAFTYMFNDKDFVKKAIGPIILGILMGVSQVFMPTEESIKWTTMNLVASLTLIISGLILVGYEFSCIKNMRETNELAYFDLPKNTICGLKNYLAALIFIIPLALAFGLIVLLSLMLGSAGFVVVIIAVLVSFYFILKYIYRILAFMNIFAQTESLTYLFQLKKAGTMIDKNKKRYSKFFTAYICYPILLGFVAAIVISIVTFISPIAAGILSGFWIAYLNYIYIYLIANSLDESSIEELQK